MPQPAHHARLVADADLAHVDAHVEMRRELAHELAEVDALLGLEVEHRVLAVEQVLHRNRVHLLAGGGRHLFEHRQRLGGQPLHLGGLLQIGLVGLALDGLEGAFQLLDPLVIDLDHVVGHVSQLDAARGAHHHSVAFGHLHLAGIEPQRAVVVLQFNGGNPRHSKTSLYRVLDGSAWARRGPYRASRTSSRRQSMHVSGDTL